MLFEGHLKKDLAGYWIKHQAIIICYGLFSVRSVEGASWQIQLLMKPAESGAKIKKYLCCSSSYSV